MNKQNYAVCCYTCGHNGQETCKGCNTILNDENEPYENWQLREDLCQKDNQIADLQHKLEVAKNAFELLSKSNISNVMEEERQTLIDYIKEQAEKEVKGEQL